MQAFLRINYDNKRYKDLKIYGEGVSRFAPIRHCQTLSDTRF